MVGYQRGKKAEARATLAQARAGNRNLPPLQKSGDSWHDWLILRLLIKEAENLIEANKDEARVSAEDLARKLAKTPPTGSARSGWLAQSPPVDREFVCDDEVFAHLAEQRPRDVVLWVARSRYLISQGDQVQAARVALRVCELAPEEPFNWFWAAPLLVTTGDLADYRRVCREMLTRFGSTLAPEFGLPG
jgi:hypothetical protein